MKAYNFSKIDTREKKFYAIADLKISSSGLPVKFLIILVICEVISLVINGAIAGAINYCYFNPFQGDDIDPLGLALVIGIPGAIAAGLFYCKISSYRLYQFLILYYKPKIPITHNGKKVKKTRVNFDAFLENQYHLDKKNN